MAPSSHAFAAHLDRLADGLAQVEAAMREQIRGDVPFMELAGGHLMQAGGKRVRPALVLLSSELCGYTGPRRVQIAAAIEFLHSATLLHDDVVDESDLRRGLPAANALWGNKRAVLVGDFFYSRSSRMIVEDGDYDILRVFAETIGRMAEGELLQLQRSFDPEASESHYYRVIDRKSAQLLSASCEVGSILAGVTLAERRRLADFGREFGLAFQIRDDALDYSADEQVLGKHPHTDLREGKVTLPLLLTLKRCTPAERAVAERVLKATAEAEQREGAEPVDLSPVLELVELHRGVEDTNRRAHERVARALEAIAPFPDGPARQALEAAADYAVARAT